MKLQASHPVKEMTKIHILISKHLLILANKDCIFLISFFLSPFNNSILSPP